MRDDTRRTKNAVRRWADLGPSDPMVLDDQLDDLRPSQYRYILRRRLNQEFEGEVCFPMSAPQWNKAQSKMKTVRNVRDEVRRRMETGTCEPPS